MAELDAGKSAVGDGAQRFLTFRVDQRLYALPASEISEVIRLPAFARVPQSPKSLLGVANLRGAVLPLASLRALLGRQEAAASPTARAIVLDGAAPVALAVDSVDALITLDADKVETRQAQLSADEGELLRGAFRAGVGDDIAKILDVKSLLDADFVQRARAPRTAPLAPGLALTAQATDIAEAQQMLVTFEVAGQEYALGLDDVQEILPAPANLAVFPRAEALVLGVTAFRDTLLPLLSLRGLLGFAEADATDDLQKVIACARPSGPTGSPSTRRRRCWRPGPAARPGSRPSCAPRAAVA
jgi:purine-binding chemotaxis protein CheW